MKKIIYTKQNKDTALINSKEDLIDVIEESENVIACHRESDAVFFVTFEGGDDHFQLNYKNVEGTKLDGSQTSFETLINYYDLIAISDKELVAKLFN